MKMNIGLAFTLLITGCGGAGLNSGGVSSAGKSKPIDTSFYQEWVHSYEEQNGQKTPNIFRPKGNREFPLSRFRMKFAFDQLGQCTYKYLSPTDAHELRNCVYTKIGNAVYLYDSAGGSLNHLAFTIQSVNANEMRMTYGVAAPVSKDAAKKKKKS